MTSEDESALVLPEKEDKQVEEELWEAHGAERGVWTKNMLTALDKGVKGNRWFSLIDKVASLKTLEIAWQKVHKNAGACGVDGIRVTYFAKDSDNRLLAVREHIKEGVYQPKPIKRVYIRKDDSSEQRPLGIPTVTDRVVQTAVKLVIEPIFERGFAEGSYGFRPGRGCKDALREVERQLRGGRRYIVDVDIKGYFDNIPHEALMKLVKQQVADGKVLGLIEGFLKQGVLEEGVIVDPVKGSPQGGVISPLLANIYLNPLDWMLKELGLVSVRYADDIVVLASTQQQAEGALETIKAWMTKAGLTLHPKKTRIVDMNEAGAYFDFLGYRFKRSSRGRLLRLVRPKSRKKLRENLRKITRRCNKYSIETIAQRINPRLRGWYEYFRHAQSGDLLEIDGWVRMRLRSILRKRQGLRGRGRGNDHQKWNNRYFENLGLFSLERAREEEVSLRRGAKC